MMLLLLLLLPILMRTSEFIIQGAAADATLEIGYFAAVSSSSVLLQ